MGLNERLRLARHRLRAWSLDRGWRQRRSAPRERIAFSAGARRRLLVLSHGDAICQSQTFPFHFYADALRARWGYELREAGAQAVLADPGLLPDAVDTICLQLWLQDTEDKLRAAVTLLRGRFPKARIGLLDPCAPSALPFAQAMDPLVDFYVKKHVLRDRSRYGRPTVGDTNLTDHFAPIYGEPLPTYRFEVPASFFDKLVVGPTFSTSSLMLPRFEAVSAPPGGGGRRYDLHARLGGVGTGNWYENMRTDSLKAVQALEGRIKPTPYGRIHKRHYMRELADSRLCFSPFGYGEVCWRDYEAAYAGALLVKPDMSHIESAPDIFLPGQTYLACAWDFSDLGAAVDRGLSSDKLRREIVGEAYARLHAFSAGGDFVERMAPALEPD
jgi:hypothetical protein